MKPHEQSAAIARYASDRIAALEQENAQLRLQQVASQEEVDAFRNAHNQLLEWCVWGTLISVIAIVTAFLWGLRLAT